MDPCHRREHQSRALPRATELPCRSHSGTVGQESEATVSRTIPWEDCRNDTRPRSKAECYWISMELPFRWMMYVHLGLIEHTSNYSGHLSTRFTVALCNLLLAPDGRHPNNFCTTRLCVFACSKQWLDTRCTQLWFYKHILDC